MLPSRDGLDDGKRGVRPQAHPRPPLGVGELVEAGQRTEQVTVDLDVSGDVGAGEPQLVVGPDQATQRAG